MLRLVWDGSLGIVFTFFNLQVSSKRNKDERVLELRLKNEDTAGYLLGLCLDR
jgi:hypothetical protein